MKDDTDTSLSFSFCTSLWYRKRFRQLDKYVEQLCLFQFQEIFTLQLTLIKQYGCFKLVHFSEKSCISSSADAEILAFLSHCSANFQPILDCFILNFKLMYEDSENMKTDRVNAVVFNLRQIKRRAFILGHPVFSYFWK